MYISPKILVRYLALGLITGVAIAGCAIRQAVRPHDWVRIHIVNIPPQVEQIYMVSRNGTEVTPLNWYRVAAGSMMVIDAKRFYPQWLKGKSKDVREGSLQWTSADQYGFLIHLNTGEWLLKFIAEGDITRPGPWRYLIGGGAEITLTAPDIVSGAPAPLELIDQIKKP